MNDAKKTALADIDRVLAHRTSDRGEVPERIILMHACVSRWAPPGSAYAEAARGAVARHERRVSYENAINSLESVLRALRSDIEADQLASFEQRVRADLLSDLLAQADYLNGEGFRRAACVLAGGALEEHVRLLASKHGIPLTNAKGEPVRVSTLNDQLQSSASAYGKADQAQISAWQKMRNDAAHGVASFEATHDANDLRRMADGIRAFTLKCPA